MAGPGGRPVGRVSVRAVPDTSTFAKSLEAYLQRVEQRLRVELPVSLSAPSVAKTEAQLAALSRDRKVKIDVETSAIDKLSKSFGSLGGGGGAVGRGGIGFLSPVLIGAIIAAVAALGAILPALLVSVAGPLAAIVVGFQGIARAAEQLALPFAVMQTTVSNVFEKGLTPVFAKLAPLFPVMTDGLVKMADALTRFTDIIITRLVAPPGLKAIQGIFDALALAFDRLSPAIGPFVDSFLLMALRGSEAFATLAPLLASVFERFDAILNFLDRTGLLTHAMEGLAYVIIAVVAAFGAIVLIAILVSAAFVAIVKLAVSMPGRVKAALSSLLGTWSASSKGHGTQAKRLSPPARTP